MPPDITENGRDWYKKSIKSSNTLSVTKMIDEQLDERPKGDKERTFREVIVYARCPGKEKVERYITKLFTKTRTTYRLQIPVYVKYSLGMDELQNKGEIEVSIDEPDKDITGLKNDLLKLEEAGVAHERNVEIQDKQFDAVERLIISEFNSLAESVYNGKYIMGDEEP